MESFLYRTGFWFGNRKKKNYVTLIVGELKAALSDINKMNPIHNKTQCPIYSMWSGMQPWGSMNIGRKLKITRCYLIFKD